MKVYFDGIDAATTAQQRQDVENLLSLYQIGSTAGSDQQRGEFLEFQEPAPGNWQRKGFVASLRIAVSSWLIDF